MAACTHPSFEIITTWREDTFPGMRRVRWCPECGTLFDEYDHDDGTAWRYRHVPGKKDLRAHPIDSWRDEEEGE